MKKILSILLFSAPAFCLAQSPAGLSIQRGKKINVVKQTSTEIDMGMGLTMNNKNDNYYSLEVLDVNDTAITFKNTLTRMTLDMDGMGQQSSYDSDKASDKDSELAKNLPPDMFQADTVQLSRKTGKIINPKIKESVTGKQDENPMNGLMEAMGSAGKTAVLSEVVFIIPGDIKVGGQWQDSVSDKGMKRVSSYQLKELSDGKATISLLEKTDLNTDSEVQGMSMQLAMNSVNQSTLQVDTKTGLLIKKDMAADMNGSIEMMGQNSPISSKSKISFTVSPQ